MSNLLEMMQKITVQFFFCRFHSDSSIRYKCSLCSNDYSDQHTLKNHHLRKHEKVTKKFRCILCSAEFSEKHTLKKHHIRKHEKIPPMFECSYCQFKFSEKSHLYRHERLHQSSKEYRCVICNAAIEGFINVKLHYQSDHPLYAANALGRKEFSCKLCPEKHNTDTGLRRHHLRVHEKAEQFPCTSCPAKFPENCQLQKHINSTHNLAKALPCCVCSKPYKDRFALNVHINEAHELYAKNVLGLGGKEQSPQRSKEPKKETSIEPESHKTIVKRIPVAGNRRSTMSGNLSGSEMSDLNQSDCVKLPKGTSSVGRASQEKNLGVQLSSDAKTSNEVTSLIDCFVCNFCAEELQSESDLRNHHLVFHRNRFPFVCKICSRKFEDSNQLASHRKDHHEAGNGMIRSEPEKKESVRKMDPIFPMKYPEEKISIVEGPKSRTVSKSDSPTTQRSLYNCLRLKRASKVKTRNPRKGDPNLLQAVVTHSGKSEPKSSAKLKRKTKSGLRPVSVKVSPDGNVTSKLKLEALLPDSDESNGKVAMKEEDDIKPTPTLQNAVDDDDDDEVVILESTFSANSRPIKKELSCTFCQHAFPSYAEDQLTLHYLTAHFGS